MVTAGIADRNCFPTLPNRVVTSMHSINWLETADLAVDDEVRLWQLPYVADGDRAGRQDLGPIEAGYGRHRRSLVASNRPCAAPDARTSRLVSADRRLTTLRSTRAALS